MKLIANGGNNKMAQDDPDMERYFLRELAKFE
jgi:hypothetical protein